jgi:hypothetical protein
MRVGHALLSFLATLALVLIQAGSEASRANAQTPVALTGQVTSAEESAMEGVLVSAKKAGSTITITVVSDAQGRYSFPAGKLAPGQYALRIRAVGYDLDNSKSVEVAAQKTATHDLKLRKTEDLAAQLSNGEWLASIPGTDRQKGILLGCVGCHTLERTMRSPHDADTFMKVVLPRMQGYVNSSIPAHPQLRRGERRMEERGDQRVAVYGAAAEYLSTINLSSGSPWKYELKTLPRPSGRATRVIYTEYDLGREVIQPHDVIVDAAGIAWSSTFGEQNQAVTDPLRIGQLMNGKNERPAASGSVGAAKTALGTASQAARIRHGTNWRGAVVAGAVLASAVRRKLCIRTASGFRDSRSADFNLRQAHGQF